jgi:hypothetical protein
MELTDQRVLRKLAVVGARFAAIIPDDAFVDEFELAEDSAPDYPLLVDSKGDPLGGGYNIFYSKRQTQAQAEGSARADAVIDFAKALRDELGDQLDPASLL